MWSAFIVGSASRFLAVGSRSENAWLKVSETIRQALRSMSIAGSGPLTRAVLAGAFVRGAFEGNAEIFDMLVAGAMGDGFEREVGSTQQAFDVIELDPLDLLVRRAAQDAFEAGFQGPP